MTSLLSEEGRTAMRMAAPWYIGAAWLILQSPASGYELVFDVDSHYNDLSRIASSSRIADLAVVDPDHPGVHLRPSGRLRYSYTPMVPFQDEGTGILRASLGQTFAITLLDADGKQVGSGSTSVFVRPRKVFNSASLKSLVVPISGVLTSLIAGYWSASQISGNANAAANAGNGLGLVTSVVGAIATGWNIWSVVTNSYQYDERYVFEARSSKNQASGVVFMRRLSSN